MTALRFRSCVAAFVALLSLSSVSSGAPLAYDDFNYTPVGSDLDGKGGGGSFGFSNNWSGQTSYNIGAGNLARPGAPLPAFGNSVTAVAFGENRGIDRLLSSPLGTEGTSAYISVLIQPQGILHQGAFTGWFGLVLRGSTDVGIGMSSFGDEIGLEVGFERAATNVKAAIGQTFFGVIRIDFTEGVDPVYFYLNPQSGSPEPAVPSASLINLNVNFLDMVSLTGPGGVGYDSLRIGTTYADVTPIPEPSTLALTSCVAMWVGMACRKRG
ncbi:PEP-CTERM sorting domain-containing protein [Lacipirellula sp.]|uniref:PEP-CTERM sorting domain-containing protein n=1 Tax=Lacipirellula sp. TaxID=2691419 RepID=UPI003D0BE796